jgi:eukaryotic-like serine/threonine-protein kinase
MSMKAEGTFRFGEFQVDALARTLRRDEAIVTLNRRAFDVLLYLVQNPGKVVSRDELLKNVWADTFVDENSLAQSISALRRALEEKPGDNSYIVTLPGRGYQFVTPVRVVAAEGLSIVADVASDDGHGSRGLLFQERTTRTSVITEEKEHLSLPPSRNRVMVRVIAVLAVAATSLAGYYAWTQFHRVQPRNPVSISSTVPPPVPRRSIAVLGFRNLSGRPEEGWISTALAEMLSTELEAGDKLRLVSGEDIARAKLDLPLADADSLSRNTLARLHQDLDSDLIVLGSYTALDEKSGTRIRLDLRLQDTVAGETIVDVAVVGGEADLFDMVSQAGSRLREKLGVEAVSPVEAVSIRASLPSNRDAARLYSEGLARLRVFDALEARDLLQRAIAADTKYAVAHSALAEAWSRLGYDKKAQQEAKQAFDLSSNLSQEGRLVVEGRYLEIDHQYDKAIEIYRTLFALFPDNLDYGLELAGVQARASKGHDALATVDSLRKVAPPASEDPRIDLAEGDAWEALIDRKRGLQQMAPAVEKARARGARLILARMRDVQCWWFNDMQEQDAVAACRESRDIYAAAGDLEGEATALRHWGDALALTDAPKSIDLYQQAQTLYRRIGSEGGVAAVVNNLGLVYEAQGDLAAAEKMHRQAVASFRLLENKTNQAAATGNVADERMEQGDLRGALQLYQEQAQLTDQLQLADAPNSGLSALTGYNIALVRQFQGDLPGAKRGLERSLTIWQRNNATHSVSGYAMWSLGSLLLQEGDLTGSRKMYEQALALRTSADEKLTIAETQLALADLSLEEERSPAEQEVVIRQALEVFQTQKVRDDETEAWCILARALLAQGKAAAAKDAVQHARLLAARSQNPEIRWRTAITAGRIETAEKDVAHSSAGIAARKELATIITKSRALGYAGIELDARLALAEIEMRAGQTTAGRAHLAAIEADAKAKGYNLIAHKADTAGG